jgi:hypothetical protein
LIDLREFAAAVILSLDLTGYESIGGPIGSQLRTWFTTPIIFGFDRLGSLICHSFAGSEAKPGGTAK